MIRYDLRCDQNHTFDGWFANSDTFDQQAEAGLVTCPMCGTDKVRKAIMAPNVSPRTRQRGVEPYVGHQPGPSAQPAPATAPAAAAAALESAPVASGQAAPMANAAAAEATAKVAAFMRAFRAAVESHAENVGRTFADEARKIHDGEADERPIYGEATADEARELMEDGIPVLPLPVLPEERN